ncbi:MAG: ATP-binding protein [Nitrospirae bacterium]|nr:ATP-binding protein [Nitrospirota bacterium]
MIEHLNTIIKDISILYELSLSIGSSLDLKMNCDVFLKTLMARKGLTFVSVWIYNEYVKGFEKSDRATMVYANPESYVRNRELPLTHPLFSAVRDKQSVSLAYGQDGFVDIITENGIKKGAFASFALTEIGVLTIYDMTRTAPFQQKELNQLAGIMSKFARSLEGCLFHEQVVREIAERKRMEDELLKSRKLESLGVLAGGIAHDFNNLLTVVLGNIELVTMNDEPGVAASARLEEAKKATLRARDLTQQLLTFSKGGAPIRKTISIGELIRESSAFVLSGSKVKGQFIIPGDLWRTDVDEGQIGQVVHNIIMNADQAMPQGGTITVQCENSTIEADAPLPLASGNYIKISIRDQGVGIPDQHLSRIFDPYFTTKQNGTGLGLATAYSIVKKHDGYLAAESDPKAGSTFSIYLPASLKKVPAREADEEPLPAGHGTILMMDDDEIVRNVAGSILDTIGYRAVFALNGAEAISLYEEARKSGQPFDAVIMDLTIPGGMGGKEAVQKLLELDPTAKVIVSSGYSSDPIMAEFDKYGFKGVVAKPYTIRKLAKTLHDVITYE